ncbi:glucose/ribitol dehydrogenase [Artemisia annua]|uniref:Glucose/ribitol dehydrogenase n=1 Tax=Artemisia annua TaxID=35608 RepID=A0A2U1P4L8_ARTAN|nr:glucose/ribitol dehydrogenase [Artemisia annua]
MNIQSLFQRVENISGKVVLITGASTGLGELNFFDLLLKKNGSSWLMNMRKEEHVAERARELGSPDVLFVFADVSKVDESKKFVDDTIEHFGRLDHLVCNAGIGPIYSIDIEVTKYTPVMDINFWGSVYPTHFAIPHLMKTNGKIIVNASTGGVLNPPKGGFYNASKAALISFYESLRFEVSPKITITILTLGFVQTNMITARYSTGGVGVHIKKDMGSLYPTMGAEPCAKAIVDRVCEGATSITEPRFYKALFLIKWLFPQLHRLYFKIYFSSNYGQLEVEE